MFFYLADDNYTLRETYARVMGHRMPGCNPIGLYKVGALQFPLPAL